jgi:hypothetical protein
MKLDWDAIMKRMPIYAYEYEAGGLNVMTPSIDYWRPHEHPPHHMPPRGWTRIEYDLSYENLVTAIEGWVKSELTPNEKAVWFDINTGHFSNTFKYGELLGSTLSALGESMEETGKQLEEASRGWKLIIYRCDTDPDFEFSHMMKVVTKTKEERKGR